MIARLTAAAPQDAERRPDGATCEDCVFRRMLLCAMSDGAICPTFRPAERPGETRLAELPRPRLASATAA